MAKGGPTSIPWRRVHVDRFAEKERIAPDDWSYQTREVLAKTTNRLRVRKRVHASETIISFHTCDVKSDCGILNAVAVKSFGVVGVGGP